MGAELPAGRVRLRASLALTAAAALISIVAAQLIYGRFRQTYEVSDLLLTASLSVFAVANLLFSTVPQLTGS